MVRMISLSAEDVIKGRTLPTVTTDTPKQIKEQLDRLMVGQHEAKEVLAVGAYNNMIKYRNRRMFQEDYFFFEKSNILLIGPTGCGKSHLIASLSKITGLPVVDFDTTTITEAGYIGLKVDDVVKDLIRKAHQQVADAYPQVEPREQEFATSVIDLAEHGIIFLDELDKLNQNKSTSWRGQTVQEALLRLVEGKPLRTNLHIDGQTYHWIDTKNILFVFGGAFAGIDQLIDKRLNKPSMGFTGVPISRAVDRQLKVDAIDIIEYGMLPELVGRIHVIAQLTKLSKKDLIHILTTIDNSLIHQFKTLFKNYNNNGVYLDFSDEAINQIVDIAHKSKLGARVMRGLMEQVLRPYQYSVPGSDVKRVKITVKDTRRLL
jgi:ATP-dependent Clp protease ATP-binding subunit ClpX